MTDSFELYIDGELFPITNENLLKQNFEEFSYNAYSFPIVKINILFYQGWSFTFELENDAINIFFSAREELKGKNICGLLGNFDGLSNNDLKMRNGTVIAINSSNEEIHYSFGLNWMVYLNETIFSYRLGKSFHTYNNPDFKPLFNIPDQAKLSPEVKRLCASSVECLFDYFVTQNIAFANSTRHSVLRYTQREEILNMPVEMCRPFLPIEMDI